VWDEISPSTTTRCRAGGGGCSTSPSSSASFTWCSIRARQLEGILGWSQITQLQEENLRAEKQYGPLYEKFAAMELAALSKNREALAVGQKLFLNHCAQCHASDGGGSRGFPNLTDRDWLWGGDVKVIETTITEGRTGVMPPWARRWARPA
jgi:cytochrome c oxidase cbb3-type subunit 3